MSVADPMRLSRRDRAALTLALECCRSESRSVGEHRRGISHHDAAEYALANVRVVLDFGVRTYRLLDAIIDAGEDHPRLLRARLALLLRAVLRADAGDYGPTEWVGCSCQCDGDGGGPRPLRYRPLWQIERGAK